MPKYMWFVRQSRPEVHPHDPRGSVDMDTNDMAEVTKRVSAEIILYDIGDEGDELTIWKLAEEHKTKVGSGA